MLEGPSKDTDLVWEARLQGMAPDIDGKVYLTEFEGVNDAADLPAPGSLATIEITEAKDYDLIGRVTNFESPRTTRELPAQAPTLFPILA
jgi:ribosomal protein S12 methylthiotransferase